MKTMGKDKGASKSGPGTSRGRRKESMLNEVRKLLRAADRQIAEIERTFTLRYEW